MPARLDLGAAVESSGSQRSPALDRVLDAALECFIDEGLTSTTMSDVAARAAVSRVWVHRLVGDRQALIEAVLGREVERSFQVLAAMRPADPTPAAAFAEAVALVVVHFAHHPLVRRLVADELDQVAAAFADGDFLGIVADRVADVLAMALGIPPSEVRPVAEAATRVAVSLMITPSSPGGDRSPEVTALIRAAFGPAIDVLSSQADPSNPPT
jgi:AcrR family transcriptional regulator